MADIVNALTWVLREAVDLSLERLPGLRPPDASNEIRDLMAIRGLIVELGGAGDDLDRIGVELANAHSAFA